MTPNNLIVHSELTFMMALAGFALGLVYFAALRRSVALFVGRKRWFGLLALTLGRIGAAAGPLFVAAKLGAATLLAAFIGFLMARALALRVERRAG